MKFDASLDEFAARRRKAQERIEQALAPLVRKALSVEQDTGGWAEVLAEVVDQYRAAYAEETGLEAPALSKKWLDDVEAALQRAHRSAEPTNAEVSATSLWLATAILSAATVQAAIDDEEDVFLEWVTMGDGAVRHSHREVSGQQRPVGEPFDVDGHEMTGPGDATVPVELWVNCRCTLRPVLASALTAGGGWGAPSETDDEIEDDRSTLTVVVALPAQDSEVHDVGEEQKHVTLVFMGSEPFDVDVVKDAVAGVARSMDPFTGQVGGTAVLGPDKAKVLLLDVAGAAAARDRLLDNDEIGDCVAMSDTHPHYIPHMTLTYDEMPDVEALVGSEIVFDRLALWHGDDQIEYALGGEMPKHEMATQVGTAENYERVEPEDDAPPAPAPEDLASEPNPVPWYGPLAPEGIKTGDGRGFSEGSLTHRDLPLPLTWQKISADGHTGNVTVAKIEKITKRDGVMWGSGHFISTPEADEVVALLAEFGKFGVSIDADQSEFELDEEEETVWFTSARVSSACIVSIPAFAEAWVALGVDPDDEEPEVSTDEVPATVERPDDEMPKEIAAGLEKMQAAIEVAAVKTEDGPGWLTHPVDTDRLRDYWVRGPGAAKIGWGTPGDFNRCRAAVAKYVKPQHLAGYCANRHYDALGFWPGRPVAGDADQFAYEKMELEDTDASEVLSLVASGVLKAPAEWFADPEFATDDGRMIYDAETDKWGCPLTITDEGHVYGHLALWDTCHLGYPGTCTSAPHSASDYVHFLTGEVHLDNGQKAAVGPISMGGDHAPGWHRLRKATAHYEATSTVVADITVGEDEFGIWFSGWTRPGVSDEMVTALAASPLSGDWREVPGGSLELIAALATNSQGFTVPRTRVAASSEGQISLVASGVVPPRKEAQEEFTESGIDMDVLAEKIAMNILEVQSRKEKMAALAAEMGGE